MTTIEKEKQSPSVEAALSLMESGRRVREALDTLAEHETGLRFNQLVVLAAVRALGDTATVTTLAARLGRAVHTETSAVNGLVKRGYLERLQDRNGDRRLWQIRETWESKETIKLPLDSVLVEDALAAIKTFTKREISAAVPVLGSPYPTVAGGSVQACSARRALARCRRCES